MMANRTGSTRAHHAATCIGMLGYTAVAGCAVTTTDLGSSANSNNIGGADGRAVYATQAPTFGGQGSEGDAATPPLPFRLVEHVASRSFWLQDDRLCWHETRGFGESAYRASCDPQNCAATIELMQPSGRQTSFRFNVEDWPSRSRVQSNAAWRRLLFENDWAYQGEGSWITRCALTDCSSTQERIPLRPPIGKSWGGVSSESLVGLDAEYVYASNEQQIVRVRRTGPYVDPNGEYLEFEVVVSGQTFARVPQLHGEQLYWTPLNGAGDVVTCPKDGCAGEPTILTPRLGVIVDFAVDGSYLYMLEQVDSETGAKRIVRCPTSGCTDTPTAEVKASGALGGEFIVHGDYVYFSGSELDQSGTYIAVVPK